MKNKGNLFVISGPSGVGKGTVCRRILEDNKNVSVSVSATTRKPRTEDTEGVTYYFKTEAEFKQMIDEGKFLEWAVYNDIITSTSDQYLTLDPKGKVSRAMAAVMIMNYDQYIHNETFE